MKITENKLTIELVSRLSNIISSRKVLEEEEKKLKAELKAIMGTLDTQALGCGEYVCILTNRTRTEIDRDKVLLLLGAEKYLEVQKKSEYQIFEIKRA